MKTLILTGFILVVFSSAVHSSDIPEFKCTLVGTECTFENVILTSKNYEWKPISDDPAAVRIVTFKNSKIPILSHDICDAFTSMKQLNMFGSGIEIIEEGAFFSCHFLDHINLSNNLIEKLPPNLFYNNHNMEILYVANNRLSHIDDSVFLSTNKLRILHLYNNKLTEFSPLLFIENTPIRDLHVDRNELTDLDAIGFVERLPNLKYFYIQDNHIFCTRVMEITDYFTDNGIISKGGKCLPGPCLFNFLSL